MVAIVDVRRLTPRTDAVLADPRLAAAQQRLGRAIVLEAVHQAQDRARAGEITADAVADAAANALPASAATLIPVLNATGVLLHTNLGRAPLSRLLPSLPAAPTWSTTWSPDSAGGAVAAC